MKETRKLSQKTKRHSQTLATLSSNSSKEKNQVMPGQALEFATLWE